MRDRDTNRLAEHVRGHGYQVDIARSGHWRVQRDGRFLFTFSRTPTDHRARQRIMADLRRHRIPLPASNYTPPKDQR